MIILSTLINIPLYHSDKDTIGFVGLILMAIQCFLIVVSKSATTSSTGGLILALKRALLLLAPKGGVASTFTGPL